MTKLFLATANVGSVFENIDNGLERWIDEFLKAVNENSPEFVAVHFQETGGKNYQNCTKEIHIFFNEVRRRFEVERYRQIEGFVDSQSELESEFTALSSLYFVHEDANDLDVHIWNFKDKSFAPVSRDSPLHIGVDLAKTERKQKEKFPQDFFPDFKWSRKGFIRTRWRINDIVLDLVNIHLFHDSCNLIAGSAFPSPFATNRFKTLNYTLEKLNQDHESKNPMFIFGDFNFRLNTFEVFEILRRKIPNYSSQHNSNTLVIDSKVFSCPEHEQRFKKDFTWLHPYEFEASQFPSLMEWTLNFHPSYPFAEDHHENFAKTRCPAWCDRILFTEYAKATITNSHESQPVYQLVGSDVCMGDHKPVFLSFKLRNSDERVVPCVATSIQKQEVESTKSEQEIEEAGVRSREATTSQGQVVGQIIEAETENTKSKNNSSLKKSCNSKPKCNFMALFQQCHNSNSHNRFKNNLNSQDQKHINLECLPSQKCQKQQQQLFLH